jgi:hypothetical protein
MKLLYSKRIDYWEILNFGKLRKLNYLINPRIIEMKLIDNIYSILIY